MTDEMTVQAQKPSTLPYVLGGGLVGAGAVEGVRRFAPKVANYGLQTQSYNSWGDLIDAAGKDVVAFSKKFEHANDDIKGAVKEVTEALQTTDTERKNLLDSLKGMDEFKDKEEKLVKELVEIQEKADGNVEKIKKELADDILSKKNGFTDDIVGADAAEKAKNARAKAEDLLKNNDDSVKQYAERIKTETDSVKENIENFAKDKLKLADDKVSAFKDAFDGKYKDGMQKVQDAIEAGAKSLKDKGDDFLKKIKGFSKWNYAIGAVALAALGWLIAPKGNKE